MKISFKQFRAMSTRELSNLYHEAGREYEARNHKLPDGSFVHDDTTIDANINKMFEESKKGSRTWYVLKREKFGRAE